VVENAVQAMTDQPPGPKNPQGRLMVRCAIEEGQLNLVFTDTGPGMAPDVLNRMFEPLFSTKVYGVGLGMPTVRNIMAQEMGGVDVESSPGEGTRVTLWLSEDRTVTTLRSSA